MFARVRADSTTTTSLCGLCGFQDVVRFANVLVGEDARRLGFESTVGDLRRDVVPRHVGPVAFTLDGVTYEIDLTTKECQHTPRGVRALDRSRTARRGTAPKLDRQRKQDSDRAMRVRSNPRVGPVSTVMR